MIDYKEIRHSLHDHPQTAGCEEYAHDTIVKHLQGLHPSKVYTHVGGYGVIAVWESRDSRINTLTHSNIPTIAFRADTDALPIGHRCGHDGHTTILLRLAELIDEAYDSRINTLTHLRILLLWQPAEETGTGSKAVLDSGILQQYDIRAIYGLHNLPGYPLGTVVLCPHTFAAASTGVVYHLDGRETHASTPEMGINPGLAIAEIIQTFDRFNNSTSGNPHKANQSGSIDHREAGKPGQFRQSTLICVRIGQPAFGTSAGHGEVMFTLRAFTNDEMEKLLSDANQVVDEVSDRYDLKVSRTLVEPFRATENNEECVNALMRELRSATLWSQLRSATLWSQCGSADATNTNTITHSKNNPAKNFQLSIFNFQLKKEPFRWSEDFAEYLQVFPGAMFGIGSGEHQPELHHPDYDFPDALIEPAAQLFFRLASEL